MSERLEEKELREEFRRLRSETRASERTPGFQTMLERAKRDAAEQPRLTVEAGGRGRSSTQPRARALRIGGWASAAIAAGIAAVLLVGDRSSADSEFDRLVTAYAQDASGGAWTSPTRSLLDVPGMELTRSLPRIGVGVPGVAADPPETVPEGRDS